MQDHIADYFVELVLGVHERSHENIKGADAIRDELISWADSLDATVVAIAVRPADQPQEKE